MKPGQQVVCTRNYPWALVIGPWVGDERHPKFNEVLTVRKKVGIFLTFEEYPANQGYGSRHFVPLISDGELEKALKAEVVEG